MGPSLSGRAGEEGKGDERIHDAKLLSTSKYRKYELARFDADKKDIKAQRLVDEGLFDSGDS
jgi:hypothetical protein